MWNVVLDLFGPNSRLLSRSGEGECAEERQDAEDLELSMSIEAMKNSPEFPFWRVFFVTIKDM